MTEESENLAIRFARAAEAGRPRCELLRLPDGYETSLYVHNPSEGSKATAVVYLHGIQSHPGWFVGSAAALAARGHPVFQPTRRGSGDNRLDRGHARSARQLLDDVETACRLAAGRSGAGRVHLVGVSWGGKLAACYALDRQRQAQLASLTMIAPGMFPQVDVPAGKKLAIAFSLLLCPECRFRIPLSDVELFTDNEEMRQYLRSDPCRLHQATARFLYVSRRLDGMLRGAPGGCLHVPATLILASRDRIIDNAKTTEAVARLGGPHLDIKELGGAHTLEFEPNPQPFYDALTAAVARGELSAS